MTVISVDIGGTNFRIGAVAPDKSLIKFEKVPTGSVFSSDNVILDLEKALRDFSEGISFDAIAIGFPATMNRERTKVVQAPNIPFMENVPVCEHLQQAFGVPVFVERDVTFALCYDTEKYHLPAEGLVSGILFHTAEDKDIENLFLEMYKEVLLDDTYSWRLLNYMVPLLFAKLLRSYSDKAVFTGIDKKQSADNNKLRILSYINDHYRTVTLDDVASHFNYSIPHCSKLIRDETGVGFIAFVRRIKMNHAAALLLNSRTSVADIANMVGYENPESFIRVFEKVYQMSPSAYRKKGSDA